MAEGPEIKNIFEIKDIPIDKNISLECDIKEPSKDIESRALIIFVHGYGSNKDSPRNRKVAEELNKKGFTTLLFSLLTKEEQTHKQIEPKEYFELSTRRLTEVINWLDEKKIIKHGKFGIVGSGFGAGSALVFSAHNPQLVKALVCRGGNFIFLSTDFKYYDVKVPTLIIVGEKDKNLDKNQEVYNQLKKETDEDELHVVKEADKLFEEPEDALEEVAQKTTDWFEKYFPSLIEGIGRMHYDQPTDEDLLGRKPLVEALSKFLRNICMKNEGTFLLHINGRWGSGKSSILRLLRIELEKETDKSEQNNEKCLCNSKWVVINYNAWQQQRAGPPWWSIINTVYQQSLSSKSLPLTRKRKIYFLEKYWRIKNGLSHNFIKPLMITIAIITVIIILGIFTVFKDPKNAIYLNQFNIGIIIALVPTIAGLFTIFNSLGSSSLSTAREFIDKVNDPMNELSRHFKDLVKNIGNPIVIFIDDLDRCNHDFTVELLERIQTLFRDDNDLNGEMLEHNKSSDKELKKDNDSTKRRGVVYVIAADKRWLYASYDKVFDTFINSMNEQGRPLRYVFLDKIFQNSLSIPPIDDKLKQSFWEYLTKNKSKKSGTNGVIPAEKEEKITHIIKSYENSDFNEIWNKLKEEDNNDIEIDLVNRTEAAKRLASLELKEDVENFLIKYHSLIENNPRLMKIIVNSYIINTISQIVSRGKDMLDRNKLALLTILSIRWPRLCEYLSHNSEIIDKIGKVKDYPENIPEDIYNLLKDTDVINVVKGIDKNQPYPLKPDDIKKFGYN
jgi:dienelactone hydrolase/ribosomal protein L36